jgi:small-conductance mechanosensitive channel
MQQSTLVLAAVVVAGVGLAHIILGWWIRRRTRVEQAAAAGPAGEARVEQQWLATSLRHLVPPLALLIWTQGMYFVAGLLLNESTGAMVPRAQEAILWAHRLAVVGGLFWLLLRVGGLIEEFLLALAARSANTWDDLMLPLAGRAARYLLPLLALILAAPALTASPAFAQVFRNAASLVLILVVAFILFQVVEAAASFVLRQHRVDERDNLRARSIHTQVVVLKKVAFTIIAIFTAAPMLMVFESVRQFGASILASAGIAGIIVGLAAQRSIATMLAGFQIALTQPIRVDDVVIVENEWGRIEDIALTYVVVRIWDLRRLVLPITYFIERPFQNWTRSSAEILGTVFLHVDYDVPLDALRAELTRILLESTRWDGKVNVLQVTDAKERTLEVRALMSAADASLAWDLRCEVREKLIQFLQRNYPASLPRLRASLTPAVIETS